MTAPKPLPRVDYPSQDDPEVRAAYAAGLRHLADVIEAHPECPLPSGSGLSFFLHGDDSATTAAALRRAFGGGRWTKRPSHDETDLILQGMCAGLPINLWLNRNQVCERRVVGQREITETVPVGEDTRPVETVTRTEDVVDWICSPILDATDETPAAVTA